MSAVPAAQGLAEAVLRRTRWVTATGLAVIFLLAWGWLLAGAGTGMSVRAMTTWQFPPPAPGMAGYEPWTWGYALTMAAMWWVMMIAMMLPSAAPVVLLYARTYTHAQRLGTLASGPVPVVAFLAGYLAMWLAFGIAATALQWLLERAGWLDSMLMWSTQGALTAALLAAAGLYQLSAPKAACLRHCRSPAEFIARHWRPDAAGAWRMGVRHGLYCVGCCWACMALLFAGGVMNLVWIAGLSVLVLAEKLTRHGAWVARVSGLVMLAAGVALIAAEVVGRS